MQSAPQRHTRSASKLTHPHARTRTRHPPPTATRAHLCHAAAGLHNCPQLLGHIRRRRLRALFACQLSAYGGVHRGVLQHAALAAVGSGGALVAGYGGPAPTHLAHRAAAANSHWHTGRYIERQRHAAAAAAAGFGDSCRQRCSRLGQHLYVRRQLRGLVPPPPQKRKPPATLLPRRLPTGINWRNLRELHAWRLRGEAPTPPCLQVKLVRLPRQLQGGGGLYL